MSPNPADPPPQPRPGLSDPRTARAAWTRFRKLMRWVLLAALAVSLIAVGWLWSGDQPITIHMVIATVAGAGLSVLVGGGLMLLVFLSAGSGHDDDVARRPDD